MRNFALVTTKVGKNLSTVYDEKESMWMLPGYMDGLRQAGGLPIMLPLTTDEREIDQLLDMVDGVLFTGGHDVSPEMYGEEPLDSTVVICKKRDEMEKIVLNKAMERDKSILGICRGIQFINAALGGTLYVSAKYSCGFSIFLFSSIIVGERLFFASTFWRKMQNIFGECCISKLEKVAKP